MLAKSAKGPTVSTDEQNRWLFLTYYGLFRQVDFSAVRPTHAPPVLSLTTPEGHPFVSPRQRWATRPLGAALLLFQPFLDTGNHFLMLNEFSGCVLGQPLFDFLDKPVFVVQ